MKKYCFAMLLFLASFTVLTAQSQPSITIVNNTGYTIYYIRFSSTADDSWQDDRLAANEVLRTGQSVSLELPYALNVVNRYDFQLEDSDGDTYTRWNVLVAANDRIEFTFDDYDGAAAPVANGPPITIVNNTGYTVYYVRISSTASDSWGSDRLGSDEILNNGYAATVNLPYPIDVVNRYDIQLEDSDGDTYTKYNVLVTSGSRIIFTFDDFD